jgi:hypothetical protein
MKNEKINRMVHILTFLAIFMFGVGIGAQLKKEPCKTFYVKTKHQTIEMDGNHYVIIYTYQFEK